MNFVRWEIREMYSYGRGVYGYILDSLETTSPTYQTGQFMTVLLDYEGAIYRRAYPIYTVPGIDDGLGILVRSDTHYSFEAHIHETWEPGTQIFTYPPAGKMLLETPPEEGRLIICIAEHPFSASIYPIIKQVLHTEPDSQIHLLYQSPNDKEVLFQKELKALQTAFHMHFRWESFYTEPHYNPAQPIPHRELTIETIAQALSDYDASDQGTQVFICGSNQFTRMAVIAARITGYREDILRWQLFSPDIITAPAEMQPQDEYKITLYYGVKCYEFYSRPDESLIDSISHYKLDIPYSCRGGTCGECAVIVRKGDYIMTKNEVLKTKDLKENQVLLCTCFAKSDLEVCFPNYVYLSLGDKLMWD